MPRPPSESRIEAVLCRAVARAGGLALKLNPTGQAGIPDRLVLLPQGRGAFVELKAPGERPRRIQELYHARLREMGFTVMVTDSLQDAENIVNLIINHKP